MGPEDPETPAERACARLATQLGALRDPGMRVAFVAHELRALPVPAAIEILTVAAGRAELRDAPHPELLLAISVALASEPVVQRALAHAALTRGQFDLLRVIGRPAEDAEAPKDSRRVPSPPSGGRPLTLGERKALARKRDRSLLARALRDPDPEVTRILLDNPALTEEDVVRLCARRVSAPEVLRTVFRHPKWVIRYRVRRALVLNPKSPPDVSLPLSAHLNRQDARLVRTSPQLSPALREACTAESQVIH